jgi:phosphate transport system permease protein
MTTNNATTLPEQQAKKWRISGLSRFSDQIFSGTTLAFALVMAGLLIGLVIILLIDAWPAISRFGISFIGSTAWDPVRLLFGALPAIYGTLVSSLIALIIAVPISFGAAIFLVEMAPAWLSGPASFIIEMLAAIPSVIIGLWGLFVMVPAIRPVEIWIANHLGVLPIFKGTVLGGLSFFAAGIILAFMIIPIITAVSRDAMRAVPNEQREAMYALGATKWEMVGRAVLPYCRSGLVGGVILGLGRALGETMAVTMVIGNGYKLTPFLFSPGTTIASKIANEFAEAANGVPMGSLIELALILFVVTLLVNVVARLLVWRMTAVKAVTR